MRTTEQIERIDMIQELRYAGCRQGIQDVETGYYGMYCRGGNQVVIAGQRQSQDDNLKITRQW